MIPLGIVVLSINHSSKFIQSFSHLVSKEYKRCKSCKPLSILYLKESPCLSPYFLAAVCIPPLRGYFRWLSGPGFQTQSGPEYIEDRYKYKSNILQKLILPTEKNLTWGWLLKSVTDEIATQVRPTAVWTSRAELECPSQAK